ncbi:MAG: Ribonuclease P protein component [Candidatus Woesebacteria bacterium GW2011_GWA1_45_8]|uniref:Ribonuclease P protein component n=1 Tax=Candidatus Woesebacteria bacterium GW2011_GWA1_45_8 TaxID=1618559 RepID=A0A0G1Q3Y5_9BACT|nr:MAG: Ribonuclease P protein component [Candidatus Woesebacteria bacterium GW2011_GWA1_45_8]
MLPKPYQLTKVDFEKVEKDGKIIQLESFGVAYLDRGDAEPSRFGFIVSNKIARDAVDRNRIKRALREAVRQSVWQTKKGTSVLFLTKTTIANKATDEIMNEVRRALKELKLTE